MADQSKGHYLRQLTDAFVPGRSAERRPSATRELAATVVPALPISTGLRPGNSAAGFSAVDDTAIRPADAGAGRLEMPKVLVHNLLPSTTQFPSCLPWP